MNLLLQPLTLVTFFPLVGVLVLLFINAEKKMALRWTALITSLVTFGISIWVLAMFDAVQPGPAAGRAGTRGSPSAAGTSSTTWASMG